MHTTRTLNAALDRMLTLDRAFDHAFNSNGSTPRAWVPAIDVVERKDAYVLYADLPGMETSGVEIGFEQNVLTISGGRPRAFDTTDGEPRVHAAERATGSFTRSVRLPRFVDGEKIVAELKNGVLTVTVPKAQAARKIRVEG